MAKKIRVWWQNPPGAVARITVEHGSEHREVGPRGLLTLEEAAVLLKRPVHEVREEIRVGFLRAVRRGRDTFVTLQAALNFLSEERRDTEIANRTMRGIKAGRVKLIPWEQVRARL